MCSIRSPGCHRDRVDRRSKERAYSNPAEPCEDRRGCGNAGVTVRSARRAEGRIEDDRAQVLSEARGIGGGVRASVRRPHSNPPCRNRVPRGPLPHPRRYHRWHSGWLRLPVARHNRFRIGEPHSAMLQLFAVDSRGKPSAAIVDEQQIVHIEVWGEQKLGEITFGRWSLRLPGHQSSPGLRSPLCRRRCAGTARSRFVSERHSGAHDPAARGCSRRDLRSARDMWLGSGSRHFSTIRILAVRITSLCRSRRSGSAPWERRPRFSVAALSRQAG